MSTFSTRRRSSRHSGYTLIELIVAVGLFALVMTLASGGYLMMIAANRQAQAVTTGVNNLSFALETMTRTIRTGSNYSCNGGGDCSQGTVFSVVDTGGQSVTYALSGGSIVRTKSGIAIPLTDPSVTVTSLTFSAVGTAPTDAVQAHVRIVASGTVSAGPGKTQSFVIETGATMRGTDL